VSEASDFKAAENQVKSRRHHIVPRFYLEGFTGTSGALWQYDKTNPANVRKVSPISAGVIRDYNRINAANPDAYEELLALTESFAAPVVRKIQKREPLTADERYALALFVAFLKYRSPGYVESARESQEQTMNLILQLKQRHDPSFPKEELRIKMDRTGVYAAHSPVARDLADKLRSMKWAFVTTDDSCPFLTSDSPVVVINPEKRGVEMWRTTVYMSVDAELRCPISRNVALLCGHKLVRDGDYASLSSANVRDTNKLCVAQATRFVWADRKSPAFTQLVRKYA